MSKKIILFIILFLILVGAILFLSLDFFNQKITGEAIIDSYTYTKAICNESNYCQDYVIVCKNGEIVSKNPLTGAVVQHAFDWKDPRDNKTKEILC